MKDLLKLTTRAFDKTFDVPPVVACIFYTLIIVDGFYKYWCDDNKIQLFFSIVIACSLLVSFVIALISEKDNV